LAQQNESPFESIEGAQEYLALLAQTLAEAKETAEADIIEHTKLNAERRVQAIQLALYKLEKLEQHIKVSRRLLNDLRTLRRLLLDERVEAATPKAAGF
jgi:uncharacterized membrane protein YccC